MSANFNGSSTGIDITGPTPSILFPSGAIANPFTICGWVNPASGSGAAPLFMGLNTAAGAATSNNLFIGWAVGVTANVWSVFLNGGDADNSAAENIGSWSHLCATYSGTSTTTGLLMYVNGVVGTAQTGTQTTNPASTTDVFSVGSNAGGNSFWKGPMSDIGIWNVALTQQEIMALAKGRRPYEIRPQNLMIGLLLDGYISLGFDCSGRNNFGTQPPASTGLSLPSLSPSPPFISAAPAMSTIAQASTMSGALRGQYPIRIPSLTRTPPVVTSKNLPFIKNLCTV